MALDSIAVKNIVFELNNKLLGGRIDKIYQPQKDEIIMSVRSIGSNFKLLLSANPSHARAHITSLTKENPISPPMFCMVLRKHAAGGKITKIYQPDFERIIIIDFDSLNELGDMATKSLIIEIMGKHSNIMLVDENKKILDSIKHISHETSSVREVLPGKEYVFPPSQGKINPFNLIEEDFVKVFDEKKSLILQKIIYMSYTGISPVSASEICHQAGFDSSLRGEELTQKDRLKLFYTFKDFMKNVSENNFFPEIIYEPKTERLLDFSPFEMTQYSGFKKVKYSSVSELLENFYSQRANVYHIKQKAYDMRRLVTSNIERCVKKKEMQIKTEKDNENLEKWKLKGELITSNIHTIKKGTNTFKTINYYDENMAEIEIALDPTLTPAENAQKYYNKYNKAKRTLSALEVQKKQNEEELAYLESVLIGIDAATEEVDLKEIKNELMEQGFIKKKNINNKQDKRQKKSKPLHFISSDGFDIYVGKSNTQNDELTIKFAKSNDTWLHTKNIPGSHVIVSAKDESGNIPDKTLFEAANLAAYNSKGKTGSNIPVDYCLRKFVKKPKGSKPGMVIYTSNKTINITPNEVLAETMKKG